MPQRNDIKDDEDEVDTDITAEQQERLRAIFGLNVVGDTPAPTIIQRQRLTTTGSDDEPDEEAEGQTDAIQQFLLKTSQDLTGKDRLSGLILSNLISYIDEAISEANDILSLYDGIETKFMPKIYPRMLLSKPGLITPISLIRGSDRTDHVEFMNDFNRVVDAGSKIIETQTLRYNELKLVSKKSFEDEIAKVLTSTGISQMSECGEVKKELTDFVYTTFIGAYEQFTKVEVTIQKFLKEIQERFMDFERKWLVQFEPPDKASVAVATDIRTILLRTHELGRRTELLTAYFLAEILLIHPQVRKDYQSLEYYTSKIYKALVVSKGIVKMSGPQLSVALKKLIRGLNNIRGDMETLKVIINVMMKPRDDLRNAATLLHKFMAQKKRGRML